MERKRTLPNLDRSSKDEGKSSVTKSSSLFRTLMLFAYRFFTNNPFANFVGNLWLSLFSSSPSSTNYEYLVHPSKDDHLHHTPTEALRASTNTIRHLRRSVELTTPLSIRLLTYNIFLRPPFVKNNRDDYKNERLEAFLKVMNKFDVIALQEMFSLGNLRQRRLIREAEKLGFLYHVRSSPPSLTSLKFIDGGLLILSKYPIVDSDAIIYNFGNQIDSWAAKQVIYAKIQVSKDHSFHLFTTHMQASYNDTAHHHNVKNDKARWSQVEEYAAFVRSKCEDDDSPIFISGDFNMNANKKNKFHWKDFTSHLKVIDPKDDYSKREHNDQDESEEYEFLVTTISKMARTEKHLEVVDLLKEHNGGRHPATYADVHPDDSHLPRETVLTHTADLCTQECIDYLFYIDTVRNDESKKIVCRENSTKVEPFFVADLKDEIFGDVPESDRCLPFTQLSDHYGVSTIIECQPLIE